MEREVLMHFVPTTTEEKLLWEREQNALLVKENQALATKITTLAKDFVNYKKEVEKKNIPQMIEKLNKVKKAHADMEIEYKRVVNANKGFMDAVIQKNLELNELHQEKLTLIHTIATLKKQIENQETPYFLRIFKIKK
ncbi:MAG: hypothetical protein RIR01_2269 [Bacteroidota bacterium]|jgi:hypothetical protein